MSTRRNRNLPGEAHELTFTCYHRHPFLKAERACQWLADAINEARVAHQFDLWAYVFMPDHVHLVVNPRQRIYDIADLRSAIKEAVSRKAFDYLREHNSDWLEKLTTPRGKKTERHFWQTGGGYDRNITLGDTLMAMIEYIHANPVRKNFCVRPQEWRWSSAAWFYGMQEIPIPVDRIPMDWMR
jgi:putative transposase